MILLCGGEKGGTGKSTLATNLSAMRLAEGRDVLLLDTDPQASSRDWAATRDQVGRLERMVCLQKSGPSLAKDVVQLTGKFDDIVIDAGGRKNTELANSLIVADVLLTPVTSGQFDVWTLHSLDELVGNAMIHNPKLKAMVVVNRASTNPQVKDLEELQELLAEYECLNSTEAVIRDRVAYSRAVREGKGVQEMTPKHAKAAAEMETLYREVFNNAQT